MRILLDEQLPRQLANELSDHEVRTVQDEGWAGLVNGALLALAAEHGFEVFLTKDQNIEFQQSLESASIGIVVLKAPRHAIEVLRPLMPAALEALKGISPGEVRHVS